MTVLPEAKILVVDDERHILLTMQAVLRDAGYEVDIASDGESAIAAIRACTYDLVVTDLKLPGVNGLAVLAEVRKTSPATVTIMMTGYGSVNSAIEAVQLGAYEYLLKPTEVSELKQAVRRSLERKRLSEIDTLYRVSSSVIGCQDREQVASEIETAARQVLGIASAKIISYRQTMVEPFLEGTYIFGTPVVRDLLQEGTVVTENTLGDPLRGWAEEQHLKSYAVVPGICRGKLVCVLAVHNNGSPYEFHASAMRFLQALAGQCALVLANTSLVAQLQQNNLELEAANRRLRELDRLKSQFLSIATHELRTPLTIIMGYNSMLSDELANRATPAQQELLRMSIAGCQRLIRLVNSMLDMKQIEAGKMTMQMTATDLSACVRGVVNLFQAEAVRKEIHLSLGVPSRLPLLLLDRDRIEQVIINLLANAMKFTVAGGGIHVALRYSTEANTIEVAVQDTGVGIAPEDQEIIFDEFAQVQRHARDHRQEGSGLGLAIAKRIVEAHSGHISLHSKVGEGSTFTLILPARYPRPSSQDCCHRVTVRQP